jgi:hypothetical protein
MDGMRWIRRLGRRGLNLGTYVAPAPVAPAPVEQIVAEGALIGASVVRLTLRNRVIVDVLRDRRDLDVDRLAAAAAKELETLADQEWASAERIRLRRNVERAGAGGMDPERLAESLRRESVHRGMSDAFAKRAADPAVVGEIVERSRDEAWAEIAAVLSQRAGDWALVLERDPRYDQERAERLGVLVAVDLTELAQERGVQL